MKSSENEQNLKWIGDILFILFVGVASESIAGLSLLFLGPYMVSMIKQKSFVCKVSPVLSITSSCIEILEKYLSTFFQPWPLSILFLPPMVLLPSVLQVEPTDSCYGHSCIQISPVFPELSLVPKGSEKH